MTNPQSLTDISGQPTDWLQAAIQDPDTLRRAMNTMQEFIAIEATWTDTEPEGDEWRYRPYPLNKFGRLLVKAVELWDREHNIMAGFLEVGCGIGTKCVFAQEFLGVEASGFDTVPKYIEASMELAEARKQPDVEFYIADAEKFHEYGDFDIIFLNRPFKDLDREHRLDKKIYDEMHIGAFLMLGNAVSQPPGWEYIDQDVACTLWRKVCRCQDVEHFIVVTDVGNMEAQATCTLCGRDLALPPIGHQEPPKEFTTSS